MFSLRVVASTIRGRAGILSVVTGSGMGSGYSSL
jgi:hypothetical protein